METRHIKVGIFNAQSGIATTRGYWQYLTTAWKYGLPHYSDSLRKFAEVVKREAIDIIGLAEIDAGSLRTKHVDQLQLISDHSPLPHKVFFPTIPFRKTAHQGNAILSRFPIISYQNHKLPGLGEPRYLGEAEIQIGEKTISFFTTHLSLSYMYRARQIHAVAEIINDAKHPAILTGDFNVNDDSEMAIIHESNLCRVVSGPTFPSWKPSKCLDYIFFGYEFRVGQSEVHPGKFSDHLLFMAEAELQ